MQGLEKQQNNTLPLINVTILYKFEQFSTLSHTVVLDTPFSS